MRAGGVLAGHPSAAKWYSFSFHAEHDFTADGRLKPQSLRARVRDLPASIRDGGVETALESAAEGLRADGGEQTQFEIFSATIMVRLEDPNCVAGRGLEGLQALLDADLQRVAST